MLQLLRHATAPPLQTTRELRCSREARPRTAKHGSVRRSSVGDLRAPTAERARFRSRAQSQPRRQSRPQSQSRTQSRVASADRSRYRARSCSGSCPLLPLLRQPIAPHPRTLPHLRPYEQAGSCTATDGNVPLPSLDQRRAMSTQPIRARSCPQSQSWRQSRSQSQSRPQSQVLSASPLLLLRLFLLRVLAPAPTPALSYSPLFADSPKTLISSTSIVAYSDGWLCTVISGWQTLLLPPPPHLLLLLLLLLLLVLHLLPMLLPLRQLPLQLPVVLLLLLLLLLLPRRFLQSATTLRRRK